MWSNRSEDNELAFLFKFPSLKRLYYTHFSNYRAEYFDSHTKYRNNHLTPKQEAFGRQLYFGSALTKNRTYFTTIGQNSYNGASEHNELSNQLISDFLQKRLDVVATQPPPPPATIPPTHPFLLLPTYPPRGWTTCSEYFEGNTHDLGQLRRMYGGHCR